MMTREMIKHPDHFNSESYKVSTPDGTLFVFILENIKGEPFQIDLVIGKAGSAVMAWAESTARLCSELLQTGTIKVNDLIVLLSNTNSDRASRNSDSIVRSGVDGLCLALRRYQHSKYLEFKESLGLEDEYDFLDLVEDDDD